MPMLAEQKTDQPRKIKALWVGKPGRGKTMGILDFPKPMLIQDFDFRLEPLIVHATKEQLAGIEYDSYTGDDYGKFMDKMNRLETKCPYKTIFTDSLTTMADSITAYSMSLRPSERAANPQRKAFRSKGKIELLEIEDYGVEAQALTDFIDYAKILPCHFILSAHYLEWAAKNIITGSEEKVTRLLTAGKGIAAKIPALFNEVWFFDVKKHPQQAIFVIKTAGLGDVETKTALKLPTELEWTNKSLWKVVKEAAGKNGITFFE